MRKLFWIIGLLSIGVLGAQPREIRGVYRLDGRELVTDVVSAQPPSEGILLVQKRLPAPPESTEPGPLGNFFYQVNSGALIPGPQAGWPGALPFSQGLAPVQDPGSDLWGYIDLQGRVKIPFKFSKAFTFEGPWASVENAQGKTGIINPAGDYVLTPEFRDIYYFQSGLIQYRDPGKNLTILQDLKTQEILFSLPENFTVVTLGSHRLILRETAGVLLQNLQGKTLYQGIPGAQVFPTRDQRSVVVVEGRFARILNTNLVWSPNFTIPETHRVQEVQNGPLLVLAPWPEVSLGEWPLAENLIYSPQGLMARFPKVRALENGLFWVGMGELEGILDPGTLKWKAPPSRGVHTTSTGPLLFLDQGTPYCTLLDQSTGKKYLPGRFLYGEWASGGLAYGIITPEPQINPNPAPNQLYYAVPPWGVLRDKETKLREKPDGANKALKTLPYLTRVQVLAQIPTLTVLGKDRGFWIYVKALPLGYQLPFPTEYSKITGFRWGSEEEWNQGQEGWVFSQSLDWFFEPDILFR